MVGHSIKNSIRKFSLFSSRLSFCFEGRCANKDTHSSPHCLLSEEFKLMNSTDDDINFNFLQRHAKNKFTNR